MKKFYTCVTTKVDGLTVRSLTLSAQAADRLSGIFAGQSESFLGQDTVKIRFSGDSFTAGSNEILFIDQYDLPAIYQQTLTDSSMIPALTLSLLPSVTVRAVFEADTSEILFQSSGASKILKREYTLLFNGDTLNEMTDPGLVVDSSLSALFRDQRLYFRSYHKAKRFLDITDQCRAATDPQIHEFLRLPCFVCDAPKDVVDLSDDWMRKRFTSIRSLGILDNLDIESAVKKAKKYEIDIIIGKKEGREAIVLPRDKKEMKSILRFLNEEYYTGELTGLPYITNSQTLVSNIEE